VCYFNVIKEKVSLEDIPVKAKGNKIETRTVTELLKTETKGKLVDFMTIDAEGSELMILDALNSEF
jgi:hypothetical protein